VLIHDRSVERTTGKTGNIDEMTIDQIKKLNAGFYKGEEFNDQIPTVEEFLEFVSQTDVVINWELKEYPDELGQEKAFATVDKLVALIRKYGMERKSIMNSFSNASGCSCPERRLSRFRSTFST
jgi:glycerophosphoryl diester phosphodiesterase